MWRDLAVAHLWPPPHQFPADARTDADSDVTVGPVLFKTVTACSRLALCDAVEVVDSGALETSCCETNLSEDWMCLDESS